MSASTSPFADLCAVCDQPGVLYCGACKSTRFCGSRCQSLLWPSHKVLCGRDLDTFFLPPMTPEEVEQLKRLDDEADKSSSAPPVTDWTTLSDILLSPAEADPVDEYLRLLALLSSYFRLYQAVVEDGLSGKVSLTPWITLSPRGRAWLVTYNRVVYGLDRHTFLTPQVTDAVRAGRSPFKVLGVLLRQELVATTLLYQVIRPTPRLELDEYNTLLEVSQRRAADDVHRVDGLSEEQRAELASAGLQRRTSLNDVD
ncbi:hypothetical protein JCM8208_001293 [Rhodotorula glutinis]